ncbi:MAG: hypothetical protein JWN08_1365 [Frankiales bacterium]|jgi:heme-degrading monooxygenase HmoA|nr:hypothetical protein [Frankiales bacterium]
MTHSEVLTTVTLVVSPDREGQVRPAYRQLVTDGPRPDGLLRSELLHGQGGRWFIHTLWRDRSGILAARESGAPPAALLLAEQVGAEHSHEVLTVEDALDG